MVKNHSKEALHQGSTCLVSIIYKNKLKIANVGDCRAVLCRNNLAIPITKDHKPNWNDEQNRITELGGKIYKDFGDDWRICNLSVSRAFGDLDCSDYVTHQPEIFSLTITKKDDFLVLGCDGLYDCLSNQEIVHFVMRNRSSDAAEKLANHAIKSGSTDNVSVIVIFFEHPSAKPKPESNNIYIKDGTKIIARNKKSSSSTGKSKRPSSRSSKRKTEEVKSSRKRSSSSKQNDESKSGKRLSSKRKSQLKKSSSKRSIKKKSSNSSRSLSSKRSSKKKTSKKK
mgnify:FL=1